MSTKGKRVTANMKRKQEEVENMRALDETRRFPGAKAVHHIKVAVAKKKRLLHVFSELS